MSSLLANVAVRSVVAGTRQMGARSASTITSVKGREVIDSRGNPTVEVYICGDTFLMRRWNAFPFVFEHSQFARSQRSVGPLLTAGFTGSLLLLLLTETILRPARVSPRDLSPT
jgi:hypothetical protein